MSKRASGVPPGSAPVVRCGGRQLDCVRPRIMGILNVTPDSFSDGGQLLDGTGLPSRGAVLRRATAMLDAGADILDVGGESTRPGAEPVSVQHELDRVIPVLEWLQPLDCLLSIDTRHADVAAAALAAGVHLVNDIGALRGDGMIEAVQDSDVALCLMHMRGVPRSMQEDPTYEDVVNEVRQFLADRIEVCLAAGISADRLIVDPGFGFGKRLEHNLALLRRLDVITQLNAPVLVGLSRKRMLGHLTGSDVGDRVTAGVAAAVLAASNGARVIRTHDVAETRQGLAVWEAVSLPGGGLEASSIQQGESKNA